MIKRKLKSSGLSLKWLVAVFLTVVFVGPTLAQEEPPPDEELQTPGTIEGTGTYFEVTDSEYLNITLQSSEPVNLWLESVPQMVVMDIESAEGATSSQITLTGFVPSTTYYKYEDDYHNEVAFTTDGSGSYTFAQDMTIPHHIFIQAQAGTKFIPSDTEIGDWDPVTRTYTLKTDVYETIQIDEDYLILDGAAHSVIGSGPYGVYLHWRTGVTVMNLNIQGFTHGIYLINSSNNTVTDNTANSNDWSGIFLRYSSNNTLTDNTTNSNRWYGIRTDYSGGNSMTGNTACWSNYRHGIYLCRSSYNTLTDNTTNSNRWDGIRTTYSGYNSMTGNTASNNGRAGIFLCWGGGHTLTSNTAFNNGDSGIMVSSMSNTLTGNTANSNTRFGIFVGYGSSNSTLTDNTTSNNAVGIRVYIDCENNTLKRNTVSSNSSYGIRLSINSNANQIYNNNFIGNPTQACVESSSGNVFNLDKPTGGNYWSDWTTPDDNGDGFVDEPFVFDGGQDNLPWTRPDGWLVMLVEIDIKPGSYPNAINLGSHGLIPVAILSDEDFDATNVDAETVELAGSGVAVRGKGDKYMAHQEDVNGDGQIDLVVQVATENLIPGDFQDGYAILTGETFNGALFQGEDEITIVPPE